MSTDEGSKQSAEPPECPFCGRVFSSRWRRALHVFKKYLVSFVKWAPRRFGLLVLPQHRYERPILRGSTPVGYVSNKGKAISYGSQYRKMFYWGMIP